MPNSPSPIRELEPKLLWSCFADLNAIPRPSQQEDRIVAFMLAFGKRLGLKTLTDRVGNVIIKKPGTAGREMETPIILQSHLDMVHTKDAGVDFDFQTQGISMKIAGDWVTAEGTTLGADNGLGAAAIMALLASTELTHPPLEALFTIDEEVGMTGAEGLESGLLQGKTLLNLDSEEDHTFTIGCAGGIDTIVNFEYGEYGFPDHATHYEIAITGLLGGHSGLKIHEGRANAIKLMVRILNKCDCDEVGLVSMKGGNARNAIPAECRAVVVAIDEEAFEAAFQSAKAGILAEFASTEKEMSISMREIRPTTQFALAETQYHQFLLSLTAVTNGVFRMSPEVPGLVEASSNLGMITLGNGRAEWNGLQRSSVESTKLEVAQAFSAPFHLLDAEVSRQHDYPGWSPSSQSPILTKMTALYRQLFGEEVTIAACHAGLECGLISRAYPGLDMISFGPNIEEAHSTAERVSISSTQKFWKLLTEVLA